MVKWYDRIGNTIEMRVGRGWIKGTVIDGERTGDGIVNMETADGKNIGVAFLQKVFGTERQMIL